MQVAVTLPFEQSPSVVLGALGDEEFIRYATERADATITQFDRNPSPEGDLMVVVRRTVPTELIPPQARTFVGSELEIRQVEAWSRPLEGPDGARYGTVALEVLGAKVTASGTAVLTPADTGSSLAYDLIVRSSLPLVGSVVEQKVGRGLQQAIEILGEALRDWLAQK
ncbi:hypothetical protein GCM10010401_03860 [Rarobacter faecitabidus]|uniref:Uncharacterized protein DUF2505 n=1 Tax=Rarobacter faecitabidus TaxID=13243 RepID=A0A542ZU22_RARFA|nr:DUF2505 domain-containing protein [Rarobacter faecitabidus]TQL63858.1 uncharacterized protein DUF2505 [Rarobacter faecitabidus]